MPFPDEAGAEAEPTRRNMPKNRGRVDVSGAPVGTCVGADGDVSSVALWRLPLPFPVPVILLLLLVPVGWGRSITWGEGGRNPRVSVSDCSSRVVSDEDVWPIAFGYPRPRASARRNKY